MIIMTGGVNAALVVEDDMRESVGRIRLDYRFDAAAFPSGIDSVPQTLDVDFFIGLIGHPGSVNADATAFRIKESKWEIKSGEGRDH